jgi:thiol:disulfide interchange protein DsbD
VRARLVADPDAPSSAPRVGVLLEMDPGWHVYWKNPGDSGLATEVEFSLPSGFEAGPLQWPLPERFTQPGDLIAYGYHGSVLLAAEIATSGASPLRESNLAASVSWLACKDKCVLGSAELKRTLRDAKAAAGSVFDGWSGGLPMSTAGGSPPFEVSTTGGFKGDERSAELSLWLQWPRAPESVELFPEADGRIEASDPRVRTRGNLTRIDLELKRVGSGSPPATELASLVVESDERGNRRGWELRVPVIVN